MILILVTALLLGRAEAALCFSNPYIETRKAFSVPLQMLAYPEMDRSSTQCGAEWRTYGVCCNTSSLLAHVKADERNIQEASNRMVKLYENFKEVTDDIFIKYTQLALVPFSLNQPDKAAKVRAAIDFLNDQEAVNSLDLEYDGDFKADSSKCWKKISSLRASSICSVCSGRSEIYFNQNKGICSPEECKAALTSCYKVLKVTGRLIELISWMLLNQGNQTGGIYPILANGTSFSELSEKSKGKGHKGDHKKDDKGGPKEDHKKDHKKEGSPKGGHGPKEQLRTKGRSLQLNDSDSNSNPDPIEQALEFYREYKRDNLSELLQRLDKDYNKNKIHLNIAICNKFLNLANRPFIDFFTDAIADKLLLNFNVKVFVDPAVAGYISEAKDSIKHKFVPLKDKLIGNLKNWRTQKAVETITETQGNGNSKSGKEGKARKLRSSITTAKSGSTSKSSDLFSSDVTYTLVNGNDYGIAQSGTGGKKNMNLSTTFP